MTGPVPPTDPPEVRQAREIIRRWNLRNGHDAYPEALEGGFKGYQAACHTCSWRGTEHLRSGEEWATEESRRHKREARREAEAHRLETRPGV